jgi:hypothetical protein
MWEFNLMSFQGLLRGQLYILVCTYIMFVPHRKQIYEPIRRVTGIALLLFILPFFFFYCHANQLQLEVKVKNK